MPCQEDMVSNPIRSWHGETAMLSTTIKTIDAVLNGDSTISQSDKKTIIGFLRNPGTTTKQTIPRILRREDVARHLNVTPKRVDQLCQAGHLKRIYTPGTTRALGISEDSLMSLLTGRGIESEVA